MIYGAKQEIKTVQDAVVAFSDHEGINLGSLTQWYDQFGVMNRGLALKILSNIRYYPGPTLRQMVNELVRVVCRRLDLHDASRLLFVPIGGPYSGSYLLTRALPRTMGIRARQIINLNELPSMSKKGSWRAIVLMEDFSGSGKTLVDWWENVETLLLPWAEKNVELILGILVLNQMAKRPLKCVAPSKVWVSFLDEASNVFSKASRTFSHVERTQIENFCKRTLCKSDFLRGYENCGLLVAFRHGCPNNSLPILWCDSKQWTSLFRRRGL
jgi:hypothetical protein